MKYNVVLKLVFKMLIGNWFTIRYLVIGKHEDNADDRQYTMQKLNTSGKNNA